MSKVSEIMKRNWENPEFRERVKEGRERYWTQKMKKRFQELSDRSLNLGTSKVEYRQTSLDEFAKTS